MACKIFRDHVLNRRIDRNSETIVALAPYCPKHGRPYDEMDEFSSMILTLKTGRTSKNGRFYNRAIRLFHTWLEELLADEEFAICVYPSHKKGPARAGITKIAKLLSEYSAKRIDGTDVLVRAFDVDKKSHGGKRDFQEEIKSLKVANEYKIKGKQVLLLDDVTTTGVSLKAGKKVLENAGAELVALIALGRTVKCDEDWSEEVIL